VMCRAIFVADGVHRALYIVSGGTSLPDAEGEAMDEYPRENGETEAAVEEGLWRAVIATTIDEWLNGPLRKKREAEQYLFNDSHDFPFVCAQAGMNATRLRARLRRLSTKGVAPTQQPTRFVSAA
jgi:hypothetical protein